MSSKNDHYGERAWIHLLTVLVATGMSSVTLGQTVTTDRVDREVGSAEAEQKGVCGGVHVVLVEGPEPSRSQQSAPFNIAATFGAGVTAVRQVVIQQAINEWNAIIETNGVNAGSYPITFSYAPRAPGVLADTGTFVFPVSGNLDHADIVISPDFTWFEDPTPADNSEFDPIGPPGVDLLSVMRHEIGHAVGWVGSFSVRVGVLMSGSTFDPSRMNISTVEGGIHTASLDHPGDFMNRSIGTRTRRPISLYPGAALLGRAYFYDLPMRFLDPSFVGGETGSANNPWNTVGEGFAFTPVGIPMLMTPGTYVEAVPIARSTPTTMLKARGGVVTITGP